jgi:hypothetical protein
MNKTLIEENSDKTSFIEKYEEPVYQIVERPEQKVPTNYFKISAGMPMTLSTQNGYFKTDNQIIKIKKHTSTQIIFDVPFGVSNFYVETKEEGKVIRRYYEVE